MTHQQIRKCPYLNCIILFQFHFFLNKWWAQFQPINRGSVLPEFTLYLNPARTAQEGPGMVPFLHGTHTGTQHLQPQVQHLLTNTTHAGEEGNAARLHYGKTKQNKYGLIAGWLTLIPHRGASETWRPSARVQCHGSCWQTALPEMTDRERSVYEL